MKTYQKLKHKNVNTAINKLPKKLFGLTTELIYPFVITAKINDGTELGIIDSEDIFMTYRCPDPETGEIPGVDPDTGFPNGLP
ncbi:hypothetical protein LCGC14_1357140, partial [marine sediment metagenome]